jgi:hypothetical protein
MNFNSLLECVLDFRNVGVATDWVSGQEGGDPLISQRQPQGTLKRTLTSGGKAREERPSRETGRNSLACPLNTFRAGLKKFKEKALKINPPGLFSFRNS